MIKFSALTEKRQKKTTARASGARKKVTAGSAKKQPSKKKPYSIDAKSDMRMLNKVPDLVNRSWSGYIIGLDTGTSCGYSIWSPTGKLLGHDQVYLGGGVGRWTQFIDLLTQLRKYALEPGKEHLLAFELPIRHTGTEAAHVMGAWRCLIDLHWPLHMAVAIQTWKSLACDHGHATKDDYVHAANHLAGTKLAASQHDRAAAICIGYAGYQLVHRDAVRYSA